MKFQEAHFELLQLVGKRSRNHPTRSEEKAPKRRAEHQRDSAGSHCRQSTRGDTSATERERRLSYGDTTRRASALVGVFHILTLERCNLGEAAYTRGFVADVAVFRVHGLEFLGHINVK